MSDNTHFPVLLHFQIECLKTGQNRQYSTKRKQNAPGTKLYVKNRTFSSRLLATL